jgi:flagellar hook-length control protein FliK
MASISSVAQFMAMLSGINPASSRPVNTEAQGAFNRLLNPASQEDNSTTAPILTPTASNDAKNTPLDTTRPISLSSVLPQTPEAISNKITLALSSKGLSDDVIQKLQEMFSPNDLIAILETPKLDKQLNQFIQIVAKTPDKPLGTLPISIDDIAPVINDLIETQVTKIELLDNKNIIFEVNEDEAVEDILDIILDHNNVDVSTSAVLIPVETQPVNIQPIGADFISLQNAAPSLSAGFNPFSIKQSSDAGSAEITLQKLPANTTSPSTSLQSDMVQSIADRLANVIGSQNTSSSQNATSRFDAFLSADSDAFLQSDGTIDVSFMSAVKSAATSANPLTANLQATQTHPASQMVAMSLTKMASKSFDTQDSQSYRLKLDPPELGRLDIEMDFLNDSKQIKVVVNVEKPETLSMLQRDMHTLLKAMQDAGFDNISNQDLSFNLASDQGNENASQGNQSGSYGSTDSTMNEGDDIEIMIESEMSVIIDPVTGQKSVNMLV